MRIGVFIITPSLWRSGYGVRIALKAVRGDDLRGSIEFRRLAEPITADCQRAKPGPRLAEPGFDRDLLVRAD
jgi:hypothetical protein